MSILLLLGGVGVFLAGMKQMSSGMAQSAGKGVRSLFKKISGNRVAGYGVGIGTTAIVQSSSATSIMTIGLANAGIVNHHQGSAIILGAKVGTTLTAFIFAMSGLSKGSFNVGIFFASMAFFGAITSMVAKKDSTQKIALFLTGFGMLFLGLEAMGIAISGSESALGDAIAEIFKYEVMKNPIFLLIIGVVFTCIIQSSSAATGVFITLLKVGVLNSVDQSFFLVMGANIGTCMDGIMAAIGSSVNGKRLALFHTLTSAMGALFFMTVVMIFRSQVVDLFSHGSLRPEWSLAIFNLSYNVMYTLVLLALLSPLVKFTEKIFKDKSIEDKKVLKYLDERLFLNPPIVLPHVKKEVMHMASIAVKNLDVSFNALIKCDSHAVETVRENEKMLNVLNQEIADFLIKYSAVTQNVGDEIVIGTTHHIINDIERIGDHADNFIEFAEIIASSGETFSDDSMVELNQMYDKVRKVLDVGLSAYESRNFSKLQEVSSLENEIDAMNKEFSSRHINRLSGNISKVEVQFYYDIVSELERISDHVVNIAFSIVSPTGKQNKAKEKLLGKTNI